MTFEYFVRSRGSACVSVFSTCSVCGSVHVSAIHKIHTHFAPHNNMLLALESVSNSHSSALCSGSCFHVSHTG